MKKIITILTFIMCIILSGCSFSSVHRHRFRDGICKCGSYEIEEYYINYDYDKESVEIIDLTPKSYLKKDKMYFYNGTKTVNLFFSSSNHVIDFPYLFDIKSEFVSYSFQTSNGESAVVGTDSKYITYSLKYGDNILLDRGTQEELVCAIDQLANDEYVEFWNLPINFPENALYQIDCHYNYPEEGLDIFLIEDKKLTSFEENDNLIFAKLGNFKITVTVRPVE